MANLIDRDEAIEAVWKSHMLNDFEKGFVQTILHKLSVVDAVEAVRCKNCVHYDCGVCLKIYSDGGVSQYAWQARNPDDFCSYGERRNDG